MSNGIRGVCAAVLTPLDERLAPATEKAIPYYRTLLERGCQSLNLLGTTGEALSLTVPQRLRFMEEIADSDLPLSRLMTGTSASAIADTIELTRHAVSLGFGAALIMPPRPSTSIDDDGIVSYYGAIANALDLAKSYIFLYNFPRLSRIEFTFSLVDRLMQELPGVIGGLKDSSNDVAYEAALSQAYPDLAIFPSSECHLFEAKRLGLAGCISGSVALWPERARALWDSGDDMLDPPQRELCALRKTVEKHGLIPGVRFLTSVAEGDATWERTLPPLESVADAARAKLRDLFAQIRGAPA